MPLVPDWLVIQLVVLFVAIPMYANALYYRVVQTRIRAAKASDANRERQLRALAGTGSTSHAGDHRRPPAAREAPEYAR